MLDRTCSKISGVRGIMSNVLCALIPAQWNSRAFNFLQDPEGVSGQLLIGKFLLT